MVTIAHLSDLHIDGGERSIERTRRVIDHLVGLRTPVDVVLVTGDIADHGAPAEYAHARRLIGRVAPVLCCPGNHEAREAFREVLLDEPATGAPVNRAYAAGGALFLMCDSSIRVAIVANAVSYLVTAAVIARTALPGKPAPAPQPPDHAYPERSRVGVALRDRPLLAVTLFNAVLGLNTSMLAVGVPLWVAHRTDSPLWIVSVVLVVNTVGVVLLQVPLSRRVRSIADAGRAARRSALALTSSGLLLAFSGHTAGWVTVLVVLGGAASHLFGELWQAAASWAFAFELAPEESMGQYQGVLNAGTDIAALVAPILFTGIVAARGWPGWLLPCGLFISVAVILPPVAAWAARSRNLAPVRMPVA